jgi:outer membrane protein assembly factor BamB
MYSSQSVAGGMVYFGSSDHNLYALDAVTGTLKWSFPTGVINYTSPAVVNGVVYVGSTYGQLLSLHLPGMS